MPYAMHISQGVFKSEFERFLLEMMICLADIDECLCSGDGKCEQNLFLKMMDVVKTYAIIPQILRTWDASNACLNHLSFCRYQNYVMEYLTVPTSLTSASALRQLGRNFAKMLSGVSEVFEFHQFISRFYQCLWSNVRCRQEPIWKLKSNVNSMR